MKKLMIVFVLILLMVVSVCVNAQIRSGATVKCHDGNLYVHSDEEMDYLVKQTCVNGSVIIEGMHLYRGEVMETISLPSLKRVSGILYITRCPRLKWVKIPKLLSRDRYEYDDNGDRIVVGEIPAAMYISVWNNPMFQACQVELMALRAGLPFKWDASLDSQTCSMLQAERDELTMLKEQYGEY